VRTSSLVVAGAVAFALAIAIGLGAFAAGHYTESTSTVTVAGTPGWLVSAQELRRALERCGAASGYKSFGEKDWFNLGADWLVKQQDKESGAWDGANNPSTSFALLFLGRGRSPCAALAGASAYAPLAAATAAAWPSPRGRPPAIPPA